MGRIIKLILILIVGSAILFAGAATLLVTQVKQEQVKNWLVQLVEEQSERKLLLAGKIEWLFVPSFGIKLNDLTLSNGPDFASTDFIKVGTVICSIKLLPLILGRIQIANLTLKDFKIWLLTNKVGRGNWENLWDTTISVAGPAKSPHQSSTAQLAITIAKVQLINGELYWEQQTRGAKLALSNLNLYARDISLGKPFLVKTSFSLQVPPQSYRSRVSLKAELTLDPKRQLYLLDDVKFLGRVTSKKLGSPLELTGTTTLLLNLAEQTLVVPALKVQLATATMSGWLRGHNITQQPIFTGDFTIIGRDLKEVGDLMGLARSSYMLPWTQALLHFNFTATPHAIKLPTLELRAGAMRLRGELAYFYSKIKSLVFKVQLNKLDLDTILGLAISTKESPAVRTRHRWNNSANESSKGMAKFFSATQVAGELKIAQLSWQQLNFANFTATINGNKGVFTWPHMDAECYQGRIATVGMLDLRSTTPKLNFKLMADAISLHPLLVEIAKYNKLSGTLALQADLSMYGNNRATMLRTLSGNGVCTILAGAYWGIDLSYEVRRALALLQQKSMPSLPSQPERSAFTKVLMPFKLAHGWLSSDALRLTAKEYHVTGGGKANLVDRQLDLKLSAYSNHDASFVVPITVKGSFTNPAIRPDVALLVKRVVAKEAAEQLGKVLPEVPQNIGELWERLMP